MATYSVYNIKVDNLLSFTPGPTAGYVLAIDTNGNTYWSAGGSGGSGSAGSSGTSGSSGSSGSSGTSGVNGQNGISSGQIYYFNESQNSDVSGYKVLDINPSTASQQTVTTSLTGNQQGKLISDYITPQLGFAVIPGGVQRFHTHLLKQASNDAIEYYVEIQLADSTGTPIGPTLSTGKSLIGWVDASTPVEVNVDLTLPTTTIDPTSRFIVRLYLDNNTSSAKSIVYYTEGLSYYSFVITSVGVVGSTSGSSGTSGTSPSQTLAQTLALGNNVGTYSIVGDNEVKLSVGASSSYFGQGVEINNFGAGLKAGGVPGGPWYGSSISVQPSFVELTATDPNFTLNAMSVQLTPGFMTIQSGDIDVRLDDNNGVMNIDAPAVNFSANPSYSVGLSYNTYLYGITSSVLAVDNNGRIIATSSTGGGSGTSGSSGSSGSSGTSGSSGVNGATGPAGSGGGGSQTLEQTLALGNTTGNNVIYATSSEDSNFFGSIKLNSIANGGGRRVMLSSGTFSRNPDIDLNNVSGSWLELGSSTASTYSNGSMTSFVSQGVSSGSTEFATGVFQHATNNSPMMTWYNQGANRTVNLLAGKIVAGATTSYGLYYNVNETAGGPNIMTNKFLYVDNIGMIVGTTSVATKPIKLSSQTLLTTGWFATGSYYGYTFSNANITTSSNVDFIPYNDSSFTVLAAGVQPYILPLSGSSVIYSQYIPSASIVGDIIITQMT